MATKIATVWEEIDRLPRKRGILKTEDILSFAKKNRASATWHWFDERGAWDDRKMAEQGRMEIASRLIQLFYTEYVPAGTGKTVKIRSMVSLSTDRSKGGGFRRIGDVLRSDQKRQVMIDDALAELNSVKERYKGVVALVPIWEAMDEVERQNTFPGDKRGAAAG